MKQSNHSAPTFDIPVTITAEFTGNVTPVLHEIRHALGVFLKTGEQTIIDLRSMPLAPGEMEHIEKELGEGEVSVVLNALGRSEIIETQYPGVWLTSHYNAEDAMLGKYIEIALVPEILLAQLSDIKSGLERLREKLNSTSTEKINETI